MSNPERKSERYNGTDSRTTNPVIDARDKDENINAAKAIIKTE